MKSSEVRKADDWLKCFSTIQISTGIVIDRYNFNHHYAGVKKVLLFRKYNYKHEKQIQVIPTIFVETF